MSPQDNKTEPRGVQDGTEKDELQARVEQYSKLLQRKVALMRGKGKYFYRGVWLSRDDILRKEKQRKRAALSLFVDLILVDCILALSILGVHTLIGVFLLPR